MDYNAPDLSKNPPRGPRVRLGGYVILPRMLDKCRAQIAGTNGEYHYSCPLDKRWFDFAGIDPLELKGEVESGFGDAEILQWITSNSTTKPDFLAIEAWSRYQEQRVPGDSDSREFFNQLHNGAAQHREDIFTWFDLLDLDDFVTFGGKA